MCRGQEGGTRLAGGAAPPSLEDWDGLPYGRGFALWGAPRGGREAERFFQHNFLSLSLSLQRRKRTTGGGHAAKQPPLRQGVQGSAIRRASSKGSHHPRTAPQIAGLAGCQPAGPVTRGKDGPPTGAAGRTNSESEGLCPSSCVALAGSQAWGTAVRARGWSELFALAMSPKSSGPARPRSSAGPACRTPHLRGELTHSPSV
jgi:hypothetical protein